MTEHPLLILMLSQLSWAQMTSSTCEETLKLKYVTISILGQYHCKINYIGKIVGQT